MVKKFHEYLFTATFNVHRDNQFPDIHVDYSKAGCCKSLLGGNLVNYNFKLYYRAGKANIDADDLLRMSWPVCVPHTPGTQHQIIAVAVQAMQKAAPEGSISPSEVYRCDLHVMDLVEDGPKVPCMTTKDWQQTQLADSILDQVSAKMQDGTLGKCPYKPTNSPKLQQLLWNATTSSSSRASCTEKFC